MIKVLVVIYNNEKKLKMLFLKYGLKYQLMTKGRGTASSSILAYFGLEKTKKNIYLSLIKEEQEKSIIDDLNLWCNLNKVGVGIAFTISLTSSSKFILDNVGGEKRMKPEKSEFELIITIVSVGYSEFVMNAAYKEGCSGGTVISGRSLGSKKTIFMDLTLEPEKELVLNIVKKDIKKKVMERITRECGIKTDARGILLSIPIDNVLGIQE